MVKVVTASVTEVIIINYFIYAGIETSAIENFGVDIGFEFHLKEEQRRNFIRSWQCKVVEINNVKRF